MLKNSVNDGEPLFIVLQQLIQLTRLNMKTCSLRMLSTGDRFITKLCINLNDFLFRGTTKLVLTSQRISVCFTVFDCKIKYFRAAAAKSINTINNRPACSALFGLIFS